MPAVVLSLSCRRVPSTAVRLNAGGRRRPCAWWAQGRGEKLDGVLQVTLCLLVTAEDAEFGQPCREGLHYRQEMLSCKLDLVVIDLDLTRIDVTLQQIHNRSQAR
jgi:hypothetical protein